MKDDIHGDKTCEKKERKKQRKRGVHIIRIHRFINGSLGKGGDGCTYMHTYAHTKYTIHKIKQTTNK